MKALAQKQGTMYRVLIASALLLAGCSTASSETAPPPPRRNPERVVRMSGGEALSYVHTETASQVLCNALPEDRLRVLLGVDSVVRERDAGGVKGVCRIADSRHSVVVDLSLKPVPGDFTPTEQLGGRPAQYDTTGKAVVDVGIAETTGYRAGSKRTPVLHAEAKPGLRETVRKLVADLVPVLAKQTDTLPDVDSRGEVDFAVTSVDVAEFVDLPKPTQALQLCTAAKDSLGFVPVRATETGTCTVRQPSGRTLVLAVVDGLANNASYTAKVLGRPAHVDESTVAVRLRDDSRLDLMIGDTDPKVAEKLVRALVQG
ncbi:hypothetical protein ALI144C_50305 [Actinosynnema sp. ALI-1.44]|uniref:hypothetical protein n=1 Tax=Actinosynnema sp. ALI-1.44 TaxID=1933779 RepID=UPI00097C0F4D|nr:hypothetical protein [Actinosynnema sp. ALI-1.44]ONI70799.1 hypothetical protein ALI144C_50305 [Actinosynnema sp. ALI-1.44]